MIRALALLTACLAAADAGGWEAPDAAARQTAQQSRDSDREARQRELLADARRRLAAARARAGGDAARSRQLAAELAGLEQRQAQRRANLIAQRAAVRDLYTAARQTSGDLIALLRNAPTAPPAPALEDELKAVATTPRALNLDDLAGLWTNLHVALTATALADRRPAPVQTAPGQRAELPVTTIGTALALAADRVAVYDRLAGAYRMLPPGDPVQRRIVAAATAANGAVVPVPFRLGQPAVGNDAVAQSVRRSGPVGVVIALLGGIGLVVLLARAIVVTNLVRAERTTAAGSGTARLRAALREHRGERAESLAGWLNACVRREARRAQWGHALLSVIIGVAPLLGLLGTVTGMIVTFHSIRLYGGGDPVLMADGISQALSTTLLGLTVAIPLLLGQRWLLARANRHIHGLDTLAVTLVADVRSRR